MDEKLPIEIGRRNWIIFAILVALSALWQSSPFTLGVAGGGMISIISYRWLHQSLRRTIAQPTSSGARSFQVRYLLRLAAVGLFIYILLDRAEVHPLGLVLGLSVVMINILWTTAVRVLKGGG
jgi:hypothetical protein